MGINNQGVGYENLFCINSKFEIHIKKLVGEFDVGEGVNGLDIGDDGKTLFVSLKKSENLIAINTENGKMKSASIKPNPYHLNTILGTSQLYLSSHSQPLI